MSGHLTFDVQCEHCETRNRVTPNNQEDEWISCHSCGGRLGTMGEVSDAFVRQISAILTEGLKRRLRALVGAAADSSDDPA